MGNVFLKFAKLAEFGGVTTDTSPAYDDERIPIGLEEDEEDILEDVEIDTKKEIEEDKD